MGPWESVPALGRVGPADSQDRMDRLIGSEYGAMVERRFTERHRM